MPYACENGLRIIFRNPGPDSKDRGLRCAFQYHPAKAYALFEFATGFGCVWTVVRSAHRDSPI